MDHERLVNHEFETKNKRSHVLLKSRMAGTKARYASAQRLIITN